MANFKLMKGIEKYFINVFTLACFRTSHTGKTKRIVNFMYIKLFVYCF